jgi:hypothetical protein
MKLVAPITLPGGFLKIAASTADFATSEVLASFGSGSPDGDLF